MAISEKTTAFSIHLTLAFHGRMKVPMRIDADRLWESLMRLARIGATERGGVNRQTLTDLDREARDQFIAWCRDAGCSIRIDATGNIFARRPGRNIGRRAVLAGSHLDTQPAGGKFDGAYGVIAALEVVRSLNDLGRVTEHPIEIVAWTNEEGCRFAPSMMGSGVFAGQFDPRSIAATTDAQGRSFGAELARIGYNGTDRVTPDEFAADFELHIEQGPVLEQAGKTIGVVTGAQGQRWFDLVVTGRESHAGTTPMETRRDALLAASRIVETVNRIARAHLPGACATVGQFDVRPNARNTIPGHVRFTVDLRHPDEEMLASMRTALETETSALCSAAGMTLELREIWHQSPLDFAAECIEAVRRGAAGAGCDAMDIVSGAGHDACHVAERVPTAMIFIPCAGGISHNELEDATREDCVAGCNVLLRTVAECASTR